MILSVYYVNFSVDSSIWHLYIYIFSDHARRMLFLQSAQKAKSACATDRRRAACNSGSLATNSHMVYKRPPTEPLKPKPYKP